MKSALLGDLLAKSSGERLGAGRELPLLSMTMRDGLVDQSAKFKKVVASRDLTAYKVVRHGQLVVGFPIDEAVLAIQRIHPAGIVSPAYDVWDVRTDLVDPDYLERYLKSPRAISYYVTKLRGSTARRRSLPKPDFDGMPVPLPPLPEQRRIASILDQADRSRRSIESRLHLLTELESSVFFDIASRAHAPRVPLADIAVTTSGGTPSRDVAEYYGPGYFWVKSGEVNQDIVLETEETITPAGMSNSSAKLMPAGTVLLAMYGATAGEVGLLGVEAATNQAVCCITPREGVSAEYLVMALKAQRATLKSIAVGGAQPNLSQGQIRTVLLPLLDSKDQARLADATRSIHDLKRKIEVQVGRSADLAKSLRQKAFTGAL